MRSVARAILVSAAICGCLSLAACADRAEDIEQKIDSIGVVTADSKAELESIEEEYRQLSDEEKERVENHEALMAASEECDRKNTDQDFLNALEQSVLGRMEKSDSDDRLGLVNTELARLESFRDAEFSNAAIEKTCARYFEGLDIQKDALSKSQTWEHQVEWQRGYVYRLEALNSLHQDCGFLSDNPEFVGSYISKYDDEKNKLDAYDAIEADLSSQGESFEYQWDDNEMSFVVSNNTEYEYSTLWEVAFKDESGIVTETSQALCEHVKPHSSYVVRVYFSHPDSGFGGTDWNNYYTDIKF